MEYLVDVVFTGNCAMCSHGVCVTAIRGYSFSHCATMDKQTAPAPHKAKPLHKNSRRFIAESSGAVMA
jgi:hypothetical protein